MQINVSGSVTALPYSTEELILDLIQEAGPDVVAEIALKCLAIALANGLTLSAVIQFASTCQRNTRKISNHFLEAGARAGSFGLPRA